LPSSFLFETLLFLLLLNPALVFLPTSPLLILIVLHALLVLFPTLTVATLVSALSVLFTRHARAHLAGGRRFNSRLALCFALSLLFRALGCGLLLLSLSGSVSLRSLRFLSLLLFLILLRTRCTTSFALGLPL
jgi:hypothetical protein